MTVPNITAPTVNFTVIRQDFIHYAILGYTNVVGFFFWPILFSSIIVYLYVKNKSAVVAAVAILVFFGGLAGTDIFLEVPLVVAFFHVVTSIILAGLAVVFLTRVRR